MYNIIQKRSITFTLSAILVCASIVALVVFGLKPSIDFTGGSLLEYRFSGERPSVEEVQNSVEALNVGSVVVQPVEEDSYILKLKFIDEGEYRLISASMKEMFETDGRAVSEERVETIGASISSQLREKAWQAGFAVVLAIVAYVAFAFRKVSKPVQSWKYGITAIIALVHDVLIVMGIFAILGSVLGVEVGIPFVVALLTILGYSVNDTIVVFDRIREELLHKKSGNFEEIVNRGVNGTLVRSVNTSITTLLVLFGLFLFGGDAIRYFSLALIIGIIFGTYSSIFVASPLLVMWQKWAKK